MTRSARLAFACLAGFLVLLPLALKKPGLPLLLAGEDATYLAMADSLIADGDLICERTDLDRLFRDFPFAEVRLELTSDDDWATARFAQPAIYPLLSAPAVGLWGANGTLVFNAACWLLALAVGWTYLSRDNSSGTSLLFSLGFFLFSATFAYLFRSQPQALVMAAVTVAIAWAWNDQTHPVRVGLSGVALGVAMLQQPILGLLAVPILSGLLVRTDGAPKDRRRHLFGWSTGVGLTILAGILISSVGLNHRWPTTGAPPTTTTFTVSNPLEIPWQEPDAIEAAMALHSEEGIRRTIVNYLEDASFFLWGRRSGVLPYFPLVLPIVALFLVRSRGWNRRWLLLVTLLALGLFQIVTEPVARALHSHQVANPHMVGVYPAFLFLLTRIPVPAIVVSYALGALTLGTLWFASLGVTVPNADIHAHTRNLPLRLLPLEYPTLGRTSGFERLDLYGLSDDSSEGQPSAHLWAPADLAEIHGDELWLLGGESVELWFETRQPLPPTVLQMRNFASENRISMRLAGQRQARDFDQVADGGISFRIDFEASEPDRVRHDRHGPTYYTRLEIETHKGEKPTWRGDPSEDTYVGVTLAFLGSLERIDRDLYATEWLGCGAPPKVAPAEDFLAAARLRNGSLHPWPHLGPARVRLSYRWRDANGQEVPMYSARAELPAEIQPGQDVASWVAVEAPEAPGSYVLELDPLFETIAWFSSRNPQATCRIEIEVAP